MTSERVELDLSWADLQSAIASGHLTLRAQRPERELTESDCHRCYGPNPVWYAPSPLWNQVMRGGSINGDELYDGIVCPTCFADIAGHRRIADRWYLTADVVHEELETVTPSGRVWDEKQRMWREATDDPA